eukprot:1160075-Pelagomonas_calceolata.AAC.4
MSEGKTSYEEALVHEEALGCRGFANTSLPRGFQGCNPFHERGQDKLFRVRVMWELGSMHACPWLASTRKEEDGCHVTLPLDVFTEVDQANGTLTSTTQPDPKAQSAQHHQGPSFLKALRLASASSATVATRRAVGVRANRPPDSTGWPPPALLLLPQGELPACMPFNAISKFLFLFPGAQAGLCQQRLRCRKQIPISWSTGWPPPAAPSLPQNELPGYMWIIWDLGNKGLRVWSHWDFMLKVRLLISGLKGQPKPFQPLSSSTISKLN